MSYVFGSSLRKYKVLRFYSILHACVEWSQLYSLLPQNMARRHISTESQPAITMHTQMADFITGHRLRLLGRFVSPSLLQMQQNSSQNSKDIRATACSGQAPSHLLHPHLHLPLLTFQTRCIPSTSWESQEGNPLVQGASEIFSSPNDLALPKLVQSVIQFSTSI